MTANADDLLPSASACRMQKARAEEDKAAEYLRRQAKADAERAELVDRLSKPSASMTRRG
jgi:hypothetical protein